jgi:hypothetical protein
MVKVNESDFVDTVTEVAVMVGEAFEPEGTVAGG